MTTQTWQRDPLRGWSLMKLYWCVGWIVGALRHDYQRFGPLIRNAGTPWHAQACAATAISRLWLRRRYTTCGRPLDVAAALAFAACNGTAETSLFLAAYDLGRRHLSSVLGLEKDFWAVALGTSIFFAYSAAIHALFWIPLAFPQHVKPTAPPFVADALPMLALMSLSWIFLYERTGDVGFLCALHALVDLSHALSIAIPGPWTTPFPTKQKIEGVSSQ